MTPFPCRLQGNILLVGTFLLQKICEICNKSNIGLYRDDGLSIFKNKSGTQLEKMKKKLQRLFKEYDLEIAAESITYKPTYTSHQKHSKHKRKIIWFNPLFSKSVSTKIGKSFLSLLDLHFPKTHIVAYSIETKSK